MANKNERKKQIMGRFTVQNQVFNNHLHMLNLISSARFMPKVYVSYLNECPNPKSFLFLALLLLLIGVKIRYLKSKIERKYLGPGPACGMKFVSKENQVNLFT